MRLLSKRAEIALEALRAGGKFRYALETDRYTGREKFKMRLIGANYRPIKGVGYAAKIELEGAKLLKYQHPHDARGSAWPQEWVLNEALEVA